MPTYRVYEVQEEVVIRQWLHVVEADDEDSAIEKAMNGESEPIEKGVHSEPEYVTWGWSLRPADEPETGMEWEEALEDMAANRQI